MKTTPIWFLEEAEIYKTVRPYRLDFDPEDENFPRTNVKRVKVPQVPIQDMRTSREELDFSKCGFDVLQVPEAITSLDFDNHQVVQQQYYPVMEGCVEQFTQKSHQGAKAIALDHKVRKRHGQFPLSTGLNYCDSQPVLVAHVDWTPDSIRKKLDHLLGNNTADRIIQKNYQFCHAWRPLVGPLNDFPLAVVDYSTVDPESDYELSDDVYEENGVDENYLVYHRPRHKWYYISDHMPTEVLFFRQFDSTIGIRSGVPHCAIPYPDSAGKVVPRQSIEVELIIYWD